MRPTRLISRSNMLPTYLLNPRFKSLRGMDSVTLFLMILETGISLCTFTASGPVSGPLVKAEHDDPSYRNPDVTSTGDVGV